MANKWLIMEKVDPKEILNNETTVRMRLTDEQMNVYQPGLTIWQATPLAPEGPPRPLVVTPESDGSYQISFKGLLPGPYKVEAKVPDPASAQKLATGSVGTLLTGPTISEMNVVVREATQALKVGGIGDSEDELLPPGGNGNGHGNGNGLRAPVPVTLQRTRRPPTEDQILWVVIRKSTSDLQFGRFQQFMDALISGNIDDLGPVSQSEKQLFTGFKDTLKTEAGPLMSRSLFPGTEAYQLLRAAADSYLMVNAGVRADFQDIALKGIDEIAEEPRVGRVLAEGEVERLWTNYKQLYPISADSDHPQALPYLSIIRKKLGEVPVIDLKKTGGDTPSFIYQIIMDKLTNPCLVELIWCYWHEEAMLVQTINAVAQRFQNRRTPGLRDPLAQLEIDPLRPMNALLWGYIQDETNRLSVLRRAHEYEHHYGFTLHGKALTEIRATDKRSKFLESFHNLLAKANAFFLRDDDTTIVADGFPILNAVKETHYLLAHGAHNQFGEMPWQARREMMLEQWLLARPEMREFLGTRVMVPYPEGWMDRVDAMKTLQGWTDTSVVHFRDLAVFGEQILLSVRYGGWSKIEEPEHAANWARYWRPEIQGYTHAYRSVTGVDLAAEVTAEQDLTARYIPPSVHLRNRLALQARK